MIAAYIVRSAALGVVSTGVGWAVRVAGTEPDSLAGQSLSFSWFITISVSSYNYVGSKSYLPVGRWSGRQNHWVSSGSVASITGANYGYRTGKADGCNNNGTTKLNSSTSTHDRELHERIMYSLPKKTTRCKRYQPDKSKRTTIFSYFLYFIEIIIITRFFCMTVCQIVTARITRRT